MLQKSLIKSRLKKFTYTDVREALARQRPMPVKVIVKDVKLLRRLWHSEYHPDAYYERCVYYYCQSCGEPLGEGLYKAKHADFCPCCGQKLWWNKRYK